jgi:hypothetical protein
MLILRFVVFLMASVVFAGSFLLIALLTPSLNNAMGVIGAVAVGFAVAIVVSVLVSTKIGGNSA